MLSLPQAKMDVNCFFLLILHHRWHPLHSVNSKMSFKKNSLDVKAAESIDQQLYKGLSGAKGKKPGVFRAGKWHWVMPWHRRNCGMYFIISFSFFWLGLRPSRKASKGTRLNRSKLLLDIASHSGCSVYFWSQIKLVPGCYFLLVSMRHTKLRALGMISFDIRIIGKTCH